MPDFTQTDVANPAMARLTAPPNGDNLDGVDIPIGEGGMISGKVTPAPSPNARVEACDIVDNQYQHCASAPIAQDGSYSLVLTPGSSVVLGAWADGYLHTWLGGYAVVNHDNDYPQYADLAWPGLVRLTVPAAGDSLVAPDLTLKEDPAYTPSVAWPMQSFTLGADMTGDNRGEILVVDQKGALWLYPGQADGTLSRVPFSLGTGFGCWQVFGPGDLNGDGQADVLGIDAAGKLWRFDGNGVDQLSVKQQVGWGWGAGWRMIPAGDFTGDGQPDLLGIDPKGDLYLYQGKSDGTFPYPKVKVGWGWKNWTLYAAGDLNGDGKADILGIDAKGDLYQYRGSGKGANPFPYAKQKAGWGWNGGFTMASGADLTGDGKADIISRQAPTGNLYFYKGLGNANFGVRTQIGRGW